MAYTISTGSNMVNEVEIGIPTTHKEFERWRKKQTFATEDLARMARLVGHDLRILEGPAGRIQLLQDDHCLTIGIVFNDLARRVEERLAMHSRGRNRPAMTVFQVFCPRCRSSQVFPTNFRDDHQCIPCGAIFDAYGDGWWSRLMRKFFYR